MTYFDILCIHFLSQWDHHVKKREEIIYREIEEWGKKLVTFIKDVMKDVLISSTMSSSDDLFASKSLTIECMLFSNEISYSLIDWSRWVEYLSSSQIFDSLRLDSSQNSWLEYLSWVRKLKSSINLKFLIQLVKTWR